MNDSTHNEIDVCSPPLASGGAFSHGLIALLVLAGSVGSIWLGCGWLARPSADPRQLIEDLRTLDRSTWSKAYALANQLGSPRHEPLRRDPQAAARLASVLEGHLAADTGDADLIQLRIFLCRALGEFETAEVLPPLILAASTRRRDADIDVQRAAVEAMAVLATKLGRTEIRANDEAMQTILSASTAQGDTAEQDARLRLLRATAAFTLGVVGGSLAEKRLEALLEDVDTNTRFNAATGLARHGNAAAIPVLAEMLDPTNDFGTPVGESPEGRQWKRWMVVTNGIRATRQLAAANPAADLGRLKKALEGLQTADVPRNVSIEARESLLALQSLLAEPARGYSD